MVYERGLGVVEASLKCGVPKSGVIHPIRIADSPVFDIDPDCDELLVSRHLGTPQTAAGGGLKSRIDLFRISACGSDVPAVRTASEESRTAPRKRSRV